MRSDEARSVAEALGSTVVATRPLAGGFVHETHLLTLTDGQVVVRLGGADPAIEAAVMTAARRHVPVPRVLGVLPAGRRQAMVLEYVTGTLLSEVLEAGAADPRALGTEVGRVAARIGTPEFTHPGFFADAGLAVTREQPWSRQLPEFADKCMATTPHLDAVTREAWAALCATHAPALTAVDARSRLVHSDLNPKNILVTRASEGWRVDAVLDWEFSYSGCPYADAANLTRFGADYPEDFLAGFHAAFADGLPAGRDWAYLGRVLDMFALSDLVTRPVGHPVADQAAALIQRWVATGIPA